MSGKSGGKKSKPQKTAKPQGARAQTAPNPKIANPELKKAAAALRAENNPQNFNAAINQMMRGAFLAPAQIELGSAPPKPDASGRISLPKDTKITFALLKGGDGQSFFTAFTDEEELKKWKGNPASQVMVLRFDDYARMLRGNDQVAGFVLNPFGENLRFTKEMVDSLLRQRNEMVARAKQAAADNAALQSAQIKPGDKVTIVEPSQYPDALVDPLCKAMEQYPAVAAAYLQIMVINGTDKSYLLILDAPKDDELFKAVALAARPYLVGSEKKMNMNITTSASPLGQQGMRGSDAFYMKGQGRIYDEDEEDEE